MYKAIYAYYHCSSIYRQTNADYNRFSPNLNHALRFCERITLRVSRPILKIGFRNGVGGIFGEVLEGKLDVDWMFEWCGVGFYGGWKVGSLFWGPTRCDCQRVQDCTVHEIDSEEMIQSSSLVFVSRFCLHERTRL